MKIGIDRKNKKNKKSALPKILTVSASVAALIGVGLLASAIYQFCYYIQEYTAQGYSTSLVIKSFLMTQLVPGVAEALVVYGGIALILFSIRKIYIKIFYGDDYRIKADDQEQADTKNTEPNENEIELNETKRNETEIKEKEENESEK